MAAWSVCGFTFANQSFCIREVPVRYVERARPRSSASCGIESGCRSEYEPLAPKVLKDQGSVMSTLRPLLRVVPICLSASRSWSLRAASCLSWEAASPWGQTARVKPGVLATARVKPWALLTAVFWRLLVRTLAVTATAAAAIPCRTAGSWDELLALNTVRDWEERGEDIHLRSRMPQRAHSVS